MCSKKYAPLVGAFKVSNFAVTAAVSRDQKDSLVREGKAGSRCNATGVEHLNLNGFYIARAGTETL